MEGRSQPIPIQAREEEALGECRGSLHSHRYVPSHPLTQSLFYTVRTYDQTAAFASSPLFLFPSVKIVHPCSPSHHQFILSAILPQGTPCLSLRSPTMLCPSVHSHLPACPCTGPFARLPVCLSILCPLCIILKSTLVLTPLLSFINCSAL